MALAGEEGHEKHDASRRQKPPPPQAFFRLFDEEDAELGGAARVGHGPCAAWPGGAAHRVAQDRGVPVLSDPRRSCAAVELLQKIVTASLVEPVQVLAVPKISLDRIPQRSGYVVLIWAE